jgi:tetratricopeptide (TPR) repeat protein
MVPMRGLVVCVVLILLSSLAHATDKAKARELYRVGTQDYNLAEYDKALDAFKEAYRNYEDPIFLFNIGQCHRQLGHKQDAVGFYRAYLRNAPDAPNRAEVNGLIEKLEAAIAQEEAAKRTAPTVAAPPAPPPVVQHPVEQPVTPSLTVTEAAPPPAKVSTKTPVYKRWWVWTIVGVVVAGAAVGTAVAVTQSAPSTPSVPTELGNYRF